MQRGLLPGALAIWGKLIPTFHSVVTDILESLSLLAQDKQARERYNFGAGEEIESKGSSRLSSSELRRGNGASGASELISRRRNLEPMETYQSNQRDENDNADDAFMKKDN